jgi:hypothetical protein
MGGMWAAARADVRANLRALVLMGLALALASAAALAAAAGARRTDTAVERAVDHFDFADVDVDLSPDPETGDTSYGDEAFARLTSLPGVERWARASYVLMVPEGFDFASGPPTVLPLAGIDAAYGRTVDRFELVDGRLTDPAAADEAVVNERFARVHGVEPGETFTLLGWPAEEMGELLGGEPSSPHVAVTFTITGVARMAQDLSDPDNEILVATPAFWEKTGEGLAQFGPSLLLRLDEPNRAMPEIVGIVEEAGGGVERVGQRGDDVEPVDRSARVEALALLAFAVLAGGLGAVIVGQTVARQDARSGNAAATLHALGATRRLIVLVLLVKVAITATAATALSVGLAYAVSDRFPLELVRGYEPRSGRMFDPFLLPSAALVAATAVVAALPGTLRWARAATASLRAADSRVRPSLATGLGRRVPPAVSSGLSMALDRGRGAVRTPVRSVMAIAVFAIVMVVGAAAFVETTREVADVPARHGWNFDLVLGSEDTSGLDDRFVPMLEEADWAAEWSSAAVTDVEVSGYGIPLFGFADGRGSVRPAVIAGRPPASATEIALGRRDLARIGASVGDVVTVEAESGRHELTIVGMSLLPEAISAGGGLGHGGFTSLDGVRDLDPEAPVNLFYIRLAEGSSTEDVLRGLGPAAAEASTPNPGEDIRNVERVLGVPVALAAVLALVAAASVAHFLLASVRRRRVDLAVLRTLGFVDRQLLGSSLTQSAVVSGLAVVAGVPLGLAAGRVVWTAIAASLGVSDEIAVPMRPLLGSMVGAPLLAALMALFAAWVAIRRPPGEVLRTE